MDSVCHIPWQVAKAKGQMASVKTSDAKEDRERAADAAKKAASYAKRVNRQVDQP